MTIAPYASALAVVVVAAVGFMWRELRAIHRQQSAQGMLLLVMVEEDDRLDVPDELRKEIAD